MRGVQEHYAKYITSGGDGPTVLGGRAADLGYEKGAMVPEHLHTAALFRAYCGSGCPLRLPGGRPTAEDRVVMDLGCGAGHDVLLAGSIVAGHETNANIVIIGVDGTAEMLAAAEENARQYPDLEAHIQFIQADFTDPNASDLLRFENRVDLILSNGVFNLCPDKEKAFQMAYRLLRLGGRLVFSDVMKLKSADVNPNATIATSINGDVFSS